MAILAKVFQASTLAALKTAIDAYLATLIGVSSPLVHGFDVVMFDQDRALNRVIIAIITLDTAAGAAMASPYVFQYAEEPSAAELETALAAAVAALPGNFISGVRNITERSVPKLNRISAWFVSNADAAVAAANWDPR